MEIKIILLLTILLYSVIAAQSLSYIISLRNVQQRMNAPEYIVFRKLTDQNFRAKFRFIVYGSLLSNLLLTILCNAHSSSWLFAGSFISFVALVADTLLALKGNLPINTIINTWTPDQYPENWAVYRKAWLQIFSRRQALNLTGFASLLVGAIFS